jgi:hypothetical protein
MKTGCFATYTGPGRICIARFAPRGTPGGYRIYKKLAPGEWFNKVSKPEYIRRYQQEVLNKLNPKAVLEELTSMAGGAEPVLLCYEKPPFTDTNWCHRRLAAAWFERHLGIKVLERVP